MYPKNGWRMSEIGTRDFRDVTEKMGHLEFQLDKELDVSNKIFRKVLTL